jgi:nucleotide-binding universal stress UspA family protein
LQIPWIDSPQVDVLTIAPQFDYFMGDGLSPIVLENEQQIFQHMQQTGSKVSQRISATLPHVESHTVRGSHVGDSIVHHATEQHSDLILIGNRSHGALHNILLGSTTKYVLRHAPCSVWVSRR